MTFFQRFLYSSFPSRLTSYILRPHIFHQRIAVPRLFPPHYIRSTYPCLYTTFSKFRSDQPILEEIRDWDERKVKKYLGELVKKKWTFPEKKIFGEHKITEFTLLIIKMNLATQAGLQKKEFYVQKYEDEEFKKYSMDSEEGFKQLLKELGAVGLVPVDDDEKLVNSFDNIVADQHYKIDAFHLKIELLAINHPSV